MCPHLEYMRCLSVPCTTSPSPLGYVYKKSRAYYPVFKSITSLEADRGMDGFHYAAFQCHFNKAHTRTFLSSKRNYKLQESEDERRAKPDNIIN